MTNRRQGKMPKRPARDYVYMAVAALILIGLLAYAVSQLGPGPDAGGTGPVPVTEISHVHGIAVNPDEPHELLVATHHGLIRTYDEQTWERIGPVQDYMGFTPHPEEGDTYYASGHPPTGGNLGFIRSTDRGLTWEQLALDGVDFHTMTASPANPDALWGYYRTGLYRTTNGGTDWSVVNPSPPRIASLAAHIDDENTLYASTPEGIQRSTDGGATFQVLAPLNALGLATHPTQPDTLYAAGAAGVFASTDSGATWNPLASSFDGGRPAYLAVDPTTPSTMYLATIESGIYRSDDGGQTWRAIRIPAA